MFCHSELKYVRPRSRGFGTMFENGGYAMKKLVVHLLCLSTCVIGNSYHVTAQTGAGARRRGDVRAKSRIAVSISNELNADRKSETVALGWHELTAHLPALKLGNVVVSDAGTSEQIVSQAVDNDGDGSVDELIFQTDFVSRTPARAFLLEPGTPAKAEPKTYGRYVPERRDDFAWENDRVAFRMYGKDLESTLVSNGVDLWTKRTRRIIMDEWFKGGDAHYHKDSGAGLICTRSRGAAAAAAAACGRT